MHGVDGQPIRVMGLSTSDSWEPGWKQCPLSGVPEGVLGNSSILQMTDNAQCMGHDGISEFRTVAACPALYADRCPVNTPEKIWPWPSQGQS